VDNDRLSEIHRDDHHTVHGQRFEHTKSAHHLSVEGTLHLRAGQAWLSESGQELHIKAGQKAVLEAGSEITLNAGGSFIKVDASGVTIVGPSIKFNAGGSPGRGTGQAAQAALLPGGVVAEVHDKVAPIKHQPTAFAETEGQAIALKKAASSGKAFCDICADTLKSSQEATG